MTTMMGYTTASNSVGHFILANTFYPILSGLCSVDIRNTENLPNPASSETPPAFFMVRRTIFNMFLVAMILLNFSLSVLAHLIFILEKVFWVLLEIVTVRLMSFTSLERSTQEMMELLYFLVPYFPVKQLQLKINAQSMRAPTDNYAVPRVRQGTHTSWFLIQFEFSDPNIRNEALSILEFNDRATYLPVFYSVAGRRIHVFSPFGFVARFPVVQMLKLYTEEYRSVPNMVCQIMTRWHDTSNNSVREFVLRVEHNALLARHVSVGWNHGHRCYADMEVAPGSGAVADMVKALNGLNFVIDLYRVNQGQIHLTGVTAARMLLSTLMIGASVLYYGVPNVGGSDGVERYAMLISLWAALQAWGFKPWLGENRVPLATLLDEFKLAVIYGVAHGNASRNFQASKSSWSMKLFDGNNELPDVNVFELFFGTHTVVTLKKAYQVAMSDGFVTEGDVNITSGMRKIKWGPIFRTKERSVEASHLIGNNAVVA